MTPRWKALPRQPNISPLGLTHTARKNSPCMYTSIQITPPPSNESSQPPQESLKTNHPASDSASLKLLDERPGCKIELKWALGHHKIRGNEKADTLAKGGSSLPSEYPFSASSAYVGNSNKKRLLNDWQTRWAHVPSHNRPTEYSVCNVNPPFLRLSKPFKTLPRKSFSRLIQCRTGHAFIGQYYKRFVPDESEACRCGERLETRNHIFQECPLYDEWRDLLLDSEDEPNIADLFGTEEGSQRTAKFIDWSGDL